MPKLTFTIGEVATLLDITPKTIRHYHKVGLLHQPERGTNNYRLYRMHHIEQLQFILRLKGFGLSLQQIKIIAEADNPDDLAQIVLQQHADSIHDEITRLQNQLDKTQQFLNSSATLSEQTQRNPPKYSSMSALSDSVKRHANGVSDILIEVETNVLCELDQFDWHEDYELFWHHAGEHFIKALTDEGLFIFWMERYLALANMAEDDLQGTAWLAELRHSPARRLIARSFMPPQVVILPEEEQQQISKLLPTLLFEYGSPMQQQFLLMLLNG